MVWNFEKKGFCLGSRKREEVGFSRMWVRVYRVGDFNEVVYLEFCWSILFLDNGVVD